MKEYDKYMWICLTIMFISMSHCTYKQSEAVHSSEKKCLKNY